VAFRCLIVDDNQDFLSSAERLLRSQGVDVVGLASSGAEALATATAFQPDVVLLDVILGEEDGFQIAERLAKTVPSARVVLISTHPADDLADELAASPAVGFVPKRSLSASAIAQLLR
jgi:two-component system nitrate/nitrite response regulator NarL